MQFWFICNLTLKIINGIICEEVTWINYKLKLIYIYIIAIIELLKCIGLIWIMDIIKVWRETWLKVQKIVRTQRTENKNKVLTNNLI